MKIFTVDIEALRPEYPSLDDTCVILVIEDSKLSALNRIGAGPKESYLRDAIEIEDFDTKEMRLPNKPEEMYDPLNYVSEVNTSVKQVISYEHARH